MSLDSNRGTGIRTTGNRASRGLLGGLLMTCAMAVSGAALAQAVVVRSTGPSSTTYPQGKKLAANAKVTLKAGDRITVLDKAGTRVLAGPGSFTLDSTLARDTTAVSRVSNVLASGAAPRTRTGAVRGAVSAPRPTSSAPGPDSVWYIDVSKGGSYCLSDPASVVLWRPNREQEATARLAAVAGGKAAEITWRKGNPLKLWPAEQLPIADGAEYTFADPLGPNRTFKLHLVGTPPADDIGVASLFADKGCTAQLDVFANAATETAAGGR
jgi:hypothetical protein